MKFLKLRFKIAFDKTTPMGTFHGVIFSLLFLFFAQYLLLTAHAATLSLDPSTGKYGPGDTFVVTVRINLDTDECINASTIELLYPKDLVKVSAVSKGESVLTLWPSEPEVNHESGFVTLSGGTPAGYCGRIEGDPGETNILAKIIFNTNTSATVSGPVTMPVMFGPRTLVLLNDGFGTPASLTLKSGEYTHTSVSSGIKNEWLDIVHSDTIKPDIFSPILHQDSKMFQGKHFIIFSAIDKQSGIHHYEVSEDDPFRFGMQREKNGKVAIFENAVSPYVLLDQELKSRIIVRAIDHAGNIQETILPPINGSDGTIAVDDTRIWWIVLIVGVSVILIGLYFANRNRSRTDAN